ncbi:hypothetical protein VPH35_097332 [Triticum aestivum]|uniref:Uncharacterized protein n=1 Tax=Aegilops tauschii subsp. strangulata TaxID=200361 RepID=A0A453KKN3_AEGTS
MRASLTDGGHDAHSRRAYLSAAPRALPDERLFRRASLWRDTAHVAGPPQGCSEAAGRGCRAPARGSTPVEFGRRDADEDSAARPISAAQCPDVGSSRVPPRRRPPRVLRCPPRHRRMAASSPTLGALPPCSVVRKGDGNGGLLGSVWLVRRENG